MPQYSIRLEAVRYLCTSCLLPAFADACLRLSDVSVICRVTYFQFPIQACFSSMSPMSVSQAAQRRTWFTYY